MRHVKIENGYAIHTEHGNSNTCGDCPVRRRNGLCPIRAESVPPLRPVCRYGHRKIASARTLSWKTRKDAGAAGDKRDAGRSSPASPVSHASRLPRPSGLSTQPENQKPKKERKNRP